MLKARISFALLAALATTPVALHADTYTYSITTAPANNDPAYSFVASGTISGPVDPHNNTAFDINSITSNGSVIGYNFTGVIAPGATNSQLTATQSGFTFDNVLYTATGTPLVDSNGFLLTLSSPLGQSLAHVFYNTPSAADPISGYEVDVVDPGDPSAYTPFAIKTFTTSPVPEPSTFALLGTGLAGLAGLTRRRFAR